MFFCEFENYLLQLSLYYVKMYRRGKTLRRYAMKREVAAFYGEFPLSMSDFKPGDTILGITALLNCVCTHQGRRSYVAVKCLTPD